MADSRLYEYNLEGVKFTAELYIGQSGEVEAKVTMLEGHADFNTMYWGDDSFVGDSATVDNPNHQPIDLEAAGIKCQDVQFDHAQKMSAPGFEWEGADKPTYLEAGETGFVTLSGETNLDNVDVLGFWGTNASTPDGEMNAVAGDGIADCGEDDCDHDHGGEDDEDDDDCDGGKSHHGGKHCGGKDDHGKDDDDDKSCGGWGKWDRDDDHGGKGGWGKGSDWGKGHDWGKGNDWGRGNDWSHGGSWGKGDCGTGKDVGWGKGASWGKDWGHGKGGEADCGGSSKALGWFKPLGGGLASKFINLDPAKFYESCMTQKDADEDQDQGHQNEDDDDHPGGGHGGWHAFL
ncbi:hypothetical protein [Gemmobacter nanjingensis]|nr:hypothetical protein [Gemmobacter nanjingensis]